ncbi:hypothetical protein WK55_22080 [Burkholderia ubonensis]|nr:hypothetical protein WK55_22080 [Burkholderia ubonensis]
MFPLPMHERHRLLLRHCERLLGLMTTVFQLCDIKLSTRDLKTSNRLLSAHAHQLGSAQYARWRQRRRQFLAQAVDSLRVQINFLIDLH